MANALGGVAQNLPIANNLQTGQANQTSRQQVDQQAAEQQEIQDSTLRTQEQQTTTETTEFQTDSQTNQGSQALAQNTTSPSVNAGSGERGSNVDITV